MKQLSDGAIKPKHGPIHESLDSAFHQVKLDNLAESDPKLLEMLSELDLIEEKPKEIITHHYLCCNQCGESLPISEFPEYKKGRKVCLRCMCEILRSKAISNPRKHAWAKATRSSHVRRGYVVKISMLDLVEMAEKAAFCPICGDEFNWSERDSLDTTWTQRSRPTLDRKDGGKILTKESAMIICQRCNSIKSNMSFMEFVEYCGKVWKKFGSEAELARRSEEV